MKTFKKGQRLLVVRGSEIIHGGEQGTVIDVSPGGLSGHTDVLVQFDKDAARGLGPMTLDAKAWDKHLEIMK